MDHAEDDSCDSCSKHIEHLEEKIQELQELVCDCPCKLDHEWCSNRVCVCQFGGCIGRIEHLENQLEEWKEKVTCSKMENQTLMDGMVYLFMNQMSMNLVTFEQLTMMWQIIF